MIPKYQDLMAPMLAHLADGNEHSHRELIATLARQFSLTDDELRERTGNGQGLFENRVYWAKVDLGKQGLVETPRKGHARITDLGREAFARLPSNGHAQTTTPMPGNLPAASVRSSASTARMAQSLPTETPEEQIDRIWQSLQDQLAEELLAQVKRVEPAFFERLVIDVLVAMGYGGSYADAKESVVGHSGDGGIDGIIKEDKLGLESIYIQAKRWESSVGRPEVQSFAGSLDSARARKGVFITTSSFTPAAQDYVGQIEKRIVLIDGRRLVRLMVEHGVGVTTVHSYELKRVDSDYFEQA